jgi:hypothetical protein
MAGGARAAEREPRRGKHRRGSGGSTWTPVVPGTRGRRGKDPDRGNDDLEDTVELPRTPPQKQGQGADRPPVAYAWPETPASGLRKFNLGTIPASVTPPRTWRRAAWFAVGTATFVVLALGFAAYQLVGNPKRNYTVDALPGQPSQQLLITALPAENVAPMPTPSSTRSTSPTSSSSARPSRTQAAPDRQHTPGQVNPGQPGPPAGRPDRPGGTNPVRPTSAPRRSTVDPAPMPPTDPEQLGDRTELYYAQVLENPAAAYALTTGPMRDEGPEGIEERYADISHIEVKKITIDPNWSYTRSELVVVREDGTTMTVYRELTFSQGTDPKISSDRPAS